MNNFTPALTETELRKQYHTLAMQHHPDKAGTDATEDVIKARTAKMQEINEEFRQATVRLRTRSSFGNPASRGNATPVDISDVEDFMRSFFDTPQGKAVIAGLVGLMAGRMFVDLCWIF